MTSDFDRENPWGATTKRDLHLYQIGCFLVFANVLAWIGFLVTFLIWGDK